jgi:hypothetical protein
MRKVILGLLMLSCTPTLCLPQQNPSIPHTAPGAEEKSPLETPTPRVLALKEGTEVKLKFAETVTSRVMRAGEMIEFTVAEAVVVDGQTLIKQGARSIGYVADSVSAGGSGKGGAIEIRLEAVRARGKMVKLTGSTSRAEKRDTGKVVTMSVLFGLGGYLSATGHEVKIPEGTPITAYVAETIEFPIQ